VTRFFLSEVGEGQAAAAGQVILHPPLVPLVADRTGLETKRLLVELARPRHVSDRVISEGDFLEHGTPFLATPLTASSRRAILFHLRSGSGRSIGHWRKSHPVCFVPESRHSLDP